MTTSRPYGGSADGKMDRLWRRGGIPDPLIWLAFVAGNTRTINLGTNVVIVPEHQPAVLAKSAATLDALAGGRVLLGIGVGELPEEYARGRDGVHEPRAADGRVHRGDAAALDRGGRVVPRAVRRLRERPVRPEPARGTIPLHVGGSSPAALRRAAKYGDGYFPFVGPGLDLHETLTRVIAEVRVEAELHRDATRATIEMTVGGARTVAEAERMAELGVDRLVVAVRSTEPQQFRDELAAFGEQVIAPSAI